MKRNTWARESNVEQKHMGEKAMQEEKHTRARVQHEARQKEKYC